MTGRSQVFVVIPDVISENLMMITLNSLQLLMMMLGRLFCAGADVLLVQVIGAGVSGLQLARSLAAHGFKVKVFDTG